MSDYTTPDKKGETGQGQNLLWTPEYRTPENAIILRRNVPTDVQNEDRFSPVNTFAFSPLAQDLFSLDNGILALIVLKLAKEQPKILAQIATKYMDNITDLLSDIIESGKTHPLSAINANTTFAVVAHRFGLITDSGYLKIADQTRAIIDKLIQLNAADIAASGMLNGLSVFAGGGKRGRSNLSKLGSLSALK